ncbi:hypothetical protein BKA81DRAFT_373397 [Phyllosticta paracitricarpa]
MLNDDEQVSMSPSLVQPLFQTSTTTMSPSPPPPPPVQQQQLHASSHLYPPLPKQHQQHQQHQQQQTTASTTPPSSDKLSSSSFAPEMTIEDVLHNEEIYRQRFNASKAALRHARVNYDAFMDSCKTLLTAPGGWSDDAMLDRMRADREKLVEARVTALQDMLEADYNLRMQSISREIHGAATQRQDKGKGRMV